jgi:hypothetical protein
VPARERGVAAGAVDSEVELAIQVPPHLQAAGSAQQAERVVRQRGREGDATDRQRGWCSREAERVTQQTGREGDAAERQRGSAA